jgi:hypothetical protein
MYNLKINIIDIVKYWIIKKINRKENFKFINLMVIEVLLIKMVINIKVN